MKKLIRFVLGLVVLAVVLFVVMGAWIGSGVKRECENAKSLYKGDCVNALMTAANDGTKTIKERSGAIWALGQLGDERALPLLERLYQENASSTVASTVDTYEIQKAVMLMKKGWNITAIIWRNSF